MCEINKFKVQAHYASAPRFDGWESDSYGWQTLFGGEFDRMHEANQFVKDMEKTQLNPTKWDAVRIKREVIYESTEMFYSIQQFIRQTDETWTEKTEARGDDD